ncbi:MAG: glycoside hydrolase family 13 protein [Jatrophihabitans sp.]|uniref:glycoside hydrolase family 13 protein n=1 Tax=Jatrophihabitans sp. TaxID=1932789 RepID=UPI003F7F14FF
MSIDPVGRADDLEHPATAPAEPSDQPLSARPWWATAVFYQIYPRSFADANGDGVGDLPGARTRLPYLRDLGVDAVWLSPFYRSPMVDAGYDVADPCDVDPVFGTLDDFDALLADAHALGIRVTVDVVPNHVSDQHPWFQEALRDPARRDRFIFRPGRGPDGDQPPNNWPSAFGGPAWTRVADGSWYLHLFAPEQPDLNWEHPDVPAEYERILRFWLDRGVDGFRVDVANSLAKEPGLPDLAPEVVSHLTSGADLAHAGDVRWDRDGVHQYHRLMRRVLDSYPGDRMAVGEAWVAPERLARYVRPDEFNLAFNFEFLQRPWSAEQFRAAIEHSFAALAPVGATSTWVLSNHDVDRVATRYGSLARARAGALVILSLPGTAFVFEGEELGLTNVELPDDALQDPTWERSHHTDRGRDGERVPIPWSGDEPPYGFSSTADTWLPMPAGWGPCTVEAQDGRAGSTLELYRAALRLRRSFATADFAWADAPADCLAYRRGDVTVLVNAGTQAVALPAGEVLLASGPVDGGSLPPDTAVWVRTAR